MSSYGNDVACKGFSDLDRSGFATDDDSSEWFLVGKGGKVVKPRPPVTHEEQESLAPFHHVFDYIGESKKSYPIFEGSIDRTHDLSRIVSRLYEGVTSDKDKATYKSGSLQYAWDSKLATLSDLFDAMVSKQDTSVATVTERKSGKEEVNISRRKGSRVTLGNSHVSFLDYWLDFRYTLRDEDFKRFEDFEVESSHCDVLYYPEGGFFKPHRDTIPDDARPGYVMYTMLLGLHDCEEGGETMITGGPKSETREYSGSCKTGGFVLFPSFFMHSGKEVLKGAKMCLKMDYWVRINPNNALLALFIHKLGQYEQGLVDHIYFILHQMIAAEEAELATMEEDYWREQQAYYNDVDDDDERWCNGYDY